MANGKRMKRSEMVEILENEINSRQYQDYQFDTETIFEILTALEKAGMLPPERKEIDSDGEEFYQEVLTNTWEPEDD